MTTLKASHLGVAGLAVVMAMLGNADRLGFHACPKESGQQGVERPIGFFLVLAPCSAPSAKTS